MGLFYRRDGAIGGVASKHQRSYLQPMKMRAPLIAVLLSVSSAMASEANAYKHYMTDGDLVACEAGDASACPQPLRWWRRETIFTLGQVAPKEFELAEVRALTEAAFAEWLEVDCTATAFDTAFVPPATFAGSSAERRATKPLTARAAPDNLIVFVPTPEEWCGGINFRACPGNSPTWIAITKIAHNQVTGEIVDADIEINNGDFKFSIDGSPALGEVDFLAMLVHEVGHFYGLDHSLLADATMYAKYSRDLATATDARSLEPDDELGICSLYVDVPERKHTPADDGCHGGTGLGLFGLFALGLMRKR